MDSTHLFICPRLMTPHWRRHLHRVVDVLFEIPAGATSFWKSHTHEPLIVGLTFPFLKNSPWQLQRQPAVLEVEGRLRRLFKRDEESAGSLLRKLWLNQRALAGMMPSKLASTLLQSSDGLILPHSKTRKQRRG